MISQNLWISNSYWNHTIAEFIMPTEVYVSNFSMPSEVPTSLIWQYWRASRISLFIKYFYLSKSMFTICREVTECLTSQYLLNSKDLWLHAYWTPRITDIIILIILPKSLTFQSLQKPENHKFALNSPYFTMLMSFQNLQR